MPKVILQPKETILKVAREILETEGYSALSIRSLANKSGVSVGTIYNYFQDKNTLDHYLMSTFWRDFELAVEAICMDQQLDFFTQLEMIHYKMADFMQLFQSLFSTALESRNYQYSQQDREEKNAMQMRIAQSIEKALCFSYPNLDVGLSPSEITAWILNSLMMVSHLRSMTYQQLVKIIKTVIQ